MSSSSLVSTPSAISRTIADVLEGDGMTTNMITAARLLGHKSVNGRYQTTMQLDKFPVLGHQMTHSIDSCTYKSTHGAPLGPWAIITDTNVATHGKKLTHRRHHGLGQLRLSAVFGPQEHRECYGCLRGLLT